MAKANNKRRGFILIASYLVIVVLIILGAAFISKSVTETRIARRQQRFIQALFLAEAGIDQGLDSLRANPGAEDPEEVGFGAGTYDYETFDLGGGSFRIESEGSVGDISRTVSVDIQEDTYARYLYFTDDEHFHWGWLKIPVWFITGDYLTGPLQSNSHLHIFGDPVYTDPETHEAVKTEDDFITYYNNGSPIDSAETSNPPYDEPTFEEGIQLGADEVPFPSKALELRTAATQGQEGAYHFNASASNPAQIVLNCDGTMTVTDNHHDNETMALPDNGAVFVTGGNVQVSGGLNGQLSIGTNRDIVIADDVTYCDDPRSNPESTDTLGLIAERDIVVSKDVPYHDYDDDGLGDVKIDASIMALGNSFMVEEWWVGPAKGTLMVYGGIIQDYRGPVGTFGSGGKQSGYSKDYQHDPRLLENPPPFYPTTGDYIIISWEEEEND